MKSSGTGRIVTSLLHSCATAICLLALRLTCRRLPIPYATTTFRIPPLPNCYTVPSFSTRIERDVPHSICCGTGKQTRDKPLRVSSPNLTSSFSSSFLRCNGPCGGYPGGFALTRTLYSPKRRSRSNITTCDMASGAIPPRKFYAVAVGRERGIYTTWEQCSRQVTGYPAAIYKSFRSLPEAREFFAEHPPSTPSFSAESMVLKRSREPFVEEDPMKELSESNISVQRHPIDDSLIRAVGGSTVMENEMGKEGKCKRVRKPASCMPTGRSRISDSDPSDFLERPSGLICRPPFVQVVYVDGACSSNGTKQARAGYGGFYGTPSDPRNFSLPVPPEEGQTNNRGELRAVIHCIVQGFVDSGAPTQILESTATTALPSPASLTSQLSQLMIYSDSKYVIDGLTKYSQRWMENGFVLRSKGPVLNKDLWLQLIRLRDGYNNIFHSQQNPANVKQFDVWNTRNDDTEGIVIHYVKAHAQIVGNEMADMFAVQGARLHDRN